MSQTIIIHPGSMYLKIGRASDLNPLMDLNCIARRRRNGGIPYSDLLLPNAVEKSKDLLMEMEDIRLQVSHTLQSCVQSDGRKRYATPPQQISAFNKRSMPEILSGMPEINWMEPNTDFIIGADVLNLSPHSQYNIHFPIRRGELNIHKHVNGSLMSVLADLQCIWEYFIQEKLNINLKDLNQYKAVLIIPAIYNRTHLKELTSLLLLKMGFGSCFLVQDHVAATFGAGLGYACVVKIGDQTTSISCVEDGISHQNTRVCLKFGGADVTQTFFWLLKKCAFPYKECQTRVLQDAMLLTQLKEEFCHLDLNICGSQEKSFVINRPEQSPVRYTLQVGDECLLTPLSLFFTELLKLTLANTTSNKMIQIQKSSGHNPDPEDCFDAEFLRETGRRGGAGIATKDLTENSLNVGDAVVVDGDEEIVVDALDNDKDLYKNFANDCQGQVLGLDQAILQSIEHCSNDELKKKMYSCILLVGGSSKFSKIERWLQNRILFQIPYTYRTEQTEIVKKDVDPAQTIWKGGAVMSSLESSPELWVTQEEYQKLGVRVLREKVPFIW